MKFTITKTSNGYLKIQARCKGYLHTKMYSGYTKKECIKRFKEVLLGYEKRDNF